ncbi:MAG: sulfatase-like hydrolase/transferase [Chloroflexota bacterium]|jgi:arylsulfatase A-like enzyme
MDRREFLKDAGLAAGGLAASSMLPNAEEVQAKAKRQGASTLWKDASERPNILVIIVDQLRYPQGLFTQALMDRAAPNLAQLRSESVSFENQFAAATMCSPSRSTMLTGLYTHQNGMFLTNAKGLVPFSSPSLDPGFPTWGSILNDPEFGYNTYWWGKWHLSSDDATTPDYAEQYGFNTGGLPCPAPNGAPGQGLGVDPVTYTVFSNWLQTQAESESGPWCTTVSLTNPHDIAWFPKYTQGRQGYPPTPGEDDPPPIFHELPANFESWPEALELQGKPGWQQAFVLTIDLLIGAMPTNPGFPGYPELWHELLDLYVQVTHYVDIQIGKVLTALEDNGVADNTIVIFTSDHGDYAGAHGMHNKGYTVYEESIHVPLYVKDPTGTFVPPDQAGTTRSQLASHVDLVPLLMTLASGSNEWRTKQKYAHLAGRADIAAILSDPDAPGRDYIIHSTDEDVPSEAHQTDASLDAILRINHSLGDPPGHVIGYRTEHAKLGVYSYFAPGTIDIMFEGQEAELYNYQQDGIDEVINRAPSAPDDQVDQALFDELYDALFNPDSGAVVNELRQPLPRHFKQIQKRAFDAYLAYQEAIGQ